MSLSLVKICAMLLVVVVVLDQSAGRTVCGPALDAVLKTICIHGYNTKFKKSMEWDDLGNNEIDDELPFGYATFPFLSKMRGEHINSLAKTRRHRDAENVAKIGVYDECCNKACTYNEILSYCNQMPILLE
ncbi:probable insulin-like peptide 3 [Ceratitis capitata]|uniref:(Mediterranean fruit fly) hypothetical protein n=1 Tax=Ceratitis capitata TaxID=7213 RepID=W8C6C5_CERCA|nr:probable insulin-like peptide 3 [Ceratitis capitata]CAD7003689.1 unnamed protein product [Ceratitis capitata]